MYILSSCVGLKIKADSVSYESTVETHMKHGAETCEVCIRDKNCATWLCWRCLYCKCFNSLADLKMVGGGTRCPWKGVGNGIHVDQMWNDPFVGRNQDAWDEPMCYVRRMDCGQTRLQASLLLYIAE